MKILYHISGFLERISKSEEKICEHISCNEFFVNFLDHYNMIIHISTLCINNYTMNASLMIKPWLKYYDIFLQYQQI